MNDNWLLWIFGAAMILIVLFTVIELQQKSLANSKISCPYGDITEADKGYNCCMKCGELYYTYLNFVKETGGWFKTGFEHCTCINPNTKEPIPLW